MPVFLLGVMEYHIVMNFWSRIVTFFDKLEDRVRAWFSRHPILYGLVGGVGIVLFWRGVWVTADVFMPYILAPGDAWYISAVKAPLLLLDGPITLAVSIILLLITGLFVSSFIGNEVILSGLRGEKKTSEKTKDEVDAEEAELDGIEKEERTERRTIAEMRDELKEMERDLEEIKEEEKNHHG